MKSHKMVFFYGSLPRKGMPPFGGGEVGNIRTIQMLSDAGYRVSVIRHARSEAAWSNFERFASYPFRLLQDFLRILRHLLFSSRNSIVHFVGFAGATIASESFFMFVIKHLGYSILYELRGGGALDFWNNGNTTYKRQFAYVLRNACYIFVQGKENLPLVKSICDTPAYVYKNCVDENFAPKTLLQKPTDKINLLFYGRVEADKHVDLIIEIAALVQQNIPNTYLTIIGNGQQSYLDLIKEKCAKLMKPDTFFMLPGCRHEQLPSLLQDKHFYIFPSTQSREGQSNSITECMSFGIIPIASPQGFNCSTIGDDYLIVDELNAVTYSRRIIEIVKSNMIDKYSRYVYNRFQSNYTQKIVFDNTLKVYSEIMKHNSLQTT